MIQTATSIFGENVTWKLLQLTGIAVLLFTVWKVVVEYEGLQSRLERPAGKQTLSDKAESLSSNEPEASRGSSAWASMGKVTPLYDFDYQAVEPLRLWKFSPKHFITMALQKSDVNNIIQIDHQYAERIKARQDIVRQYPDALDCLDSAVGMVNELYEFLIQELLPHRYPTIFRLDSSAGIVENLITKEKLPLTAPIDRYETLRKINRNVDEDFMMMMPSPDGDGYSLQSFVWAYPVGFDPQSKLGLKLRDLHKPVPGYKEKLTLSMDRYFSSVEPGKIKGRSNWAIALNDNLCERGEYHLYPGQEPAETHFELENCYVRREMQTLFALPKSGGKILSVHLYLYPLQEIKDAGLGPALADAIDGLKLGNVPETHRYKRAVVWGERVKEFFRS